MKDQVLVTPARCAIAAAQLGRCTSLGGDGITLSTAGPSAVEAYFDYGRAVGGIPTFEVQSVTSPGPVTVMVVYSETFEGINSETGDGPFFLFSNAMDCYRRVELTFHHLDKTCEIQCRHTQGSQRYQRLKLLTPDSSITFSRIGFQPVRPESPLLCHFSCSDPMLQQIWQEGTRTVDMCTVMANETRPAWEATEVGTRIFGQHWAPCRHGTRWGDIAVNFETRIEQGGASWAIHMVANGLIFCLNPVNRSLSAFEGFADKYFTFPSTPRGRWCIPLEIDLVEWINIKCVAQGSTVTVSLNGQEIGAVHELAIRPILGGSDLNTGSVAFGGPAGWIFQCRGLQVSDLQGRKLYENALLDADHQRTFSDFQVGTNRMAATIDGAKRDRAVFGGDLHVLGRALAYSTRAFDAVAGSIRLLTSHQTSDGYLGNVCPIQAPCHSDADEPPTYAFYSLTYALLVVVSIKDYWLQSGENLHGSRWESLEKLMVYVASFLDCRHLVVAPPPLSMNWFPIGGPVFGASTGINLAYYDALRAMAAMETQSDKKQSYLSQAEALKRSIFRYFFRQDTGILRMGDNLPEDGVCQDINAYAMSLGIIPVNSTTLSVLFPSASPGRAAVTSTDLPLAFQNLGHWDRHLVVSPYATGFAVEALFELGKTKEAIALLKKVWGVMVDPGNPDYSGGFWEAMNLDGTPHGHDTSLVHGWSTWPVYLLPRYLAGLWPLEPGWTRFRIQPAILDDDSFIEKVKVKMNIQQGEINFSVHFRDKGSRGALVIDLPSGTIAEVAAPDGWFLRHPSSGFLVSRIDLVGELGSENHFEFELSRQGPKRMPSTMVSPMEDDGKYRLKSTYDTSLRGLIWRIRNWCLGTCGRLKLKKSF